uniref:Uncharacterized protein n=1 Tax=Meloidogyne incognita TaxID=6306 RepID=A0A914N8F5_MELIC
MDKQHSSYCPPSTTFGSLIANGSNEFSEANTYHQRHLEQQPLSDCLPPQKNQFVYKNFGKFFALVVFAELITPSKKTICFKLLEKFFLSNFFD